jgi:hypothetical protein
MSEPLTIKSISPFSLVIDGVLRRRLPMRLGRYGFVILGLCFFLCRCGNKAPVVSLAPSSAQYASQDYPKLLNEWTRHQQVMKGLETTLRVHATWYSPAFSSAYLSRVSQMFQLSAPERAKLAQKLRDEGDKYFSFFVAAATIDEQWNDFDHKGSVWHVTLVNDQKEQLLPLDIQVEKLTPTVLELFPYAGMFYKAYTLRFPQKLSDGRSFIRPEVHQVLMRLAGPLGLAELKWCLR